jgi:hypothetical protein
MKMTETIRKTITESVYTKAGYIYLNAQTLIDIITERLKEIPEGYQQSAVCVMDVEYNPFSKGSTGCVFHIQYDRLETDKEYQDRNSKEQIALERHIANLHSQAENFGYRLERSEES